MSKLLSSDQQYILEVSGGKDSTAMLIEMVRRGYDVHSAVWVDMSVEFPEMYDHWNKLQESYPDITFVRRHVDFEWEMCERVMSKGARKGEPGYEWPLVHKG